MARPTATVMDDRLKCGECPWCGNAKGLHGDVVSVQSGLTTGPALWAGMDCPECGAVWSMRVAYDPPKWKLNQEGDRDDE